MLYRVHTSLRKGRNRLPKGTISQLSGLSASTKDKLLELERISVVIAPPVSIIPGWSEAAIALKEKFQIVYLDELLCADLDKVSEELGVSVKAIKDLMSYIEA
jgi:hypothetical protein